MSYAPEFKGAIEGWVVNHLKTNYWKIERSVPRSDVMQEAYVCFLRCKRKFPKSAEYDTPQAFMALFKFAWSNQFTDLANEDTKQRACVSDQTSEGETREGVGATDNDGFLNVMVAQAPSEVASVLALFLNAPSELLDLALCSWRKRGKNSPGGNKQLARLLGLPAETDVIGIVEEYFREPV